MIPKNADNIIAGFSCVNSSHLRCDKIAHYELSESGDQVVPYKRS